jgi:hypothetical protein
MEHTNCKQQLWQQGDFAFHAHNQLHTNKQHRLIHTNTSKVKVKVSPVNIYKITNIYKSSQILQKIFVGDIVVLLCLDLFCIFGSYLNVSVKSLCYNI